jgi:hypothetical protein
MPDLLHPAAPVVPCAPASPVPLPPHLALALPPLLVDVAVPDAPDRAPWLDVPVLGDPYPRHLFAREVAWPEPLPPVLRPDRPYNPTAHAVQLGLLPPECLPSRPDCPAAWAAVRESTRVSRLGSAVRAVILGAALCFVFVFEVLPRLTT